MSHLVDVASLAEREGFVLTTVVKEDDDTHVYVVHHHGRPRVLKTASVPERSANLARDAGYSTLLATLTAAGGDWMIRASTPVATGEGWLLRDYLDGEPLVDVAAVDQPAALRRLGAALADLDRLAPDPASRRPAYRDDDGEPVADEAHRLAELTRWVRELEGRDALGALVADDLLARLAAGQRLVQPGFEVWDVKTEDFLALPDGHVGLYDLEFAYLFGRRHYDLARLVATFAVPLDTPGAAAVLLATYLEAAVQHRSEVVPACQAVLVEALLAELYDARRVASAPRHEAACRHLQACLQHGVAGLLDAALTR